MIKLYTAAILLALTTSAQAYPTHCMRENGKEYICHLCVRGHWPSAETYECPAKEEARQERDRMKRQCMVYLPDVQDAKLRVWCLKQSERMP